MKKVRDQWAFNGQGRGALLVYEHDGAVWRIVRCPLCRAQSLKGAA